MIDRVILEVRRDNRRIHIVRRVLQGREGVNRLALRQYDNAARVLSRGAPHADTALHETVDLALSLSGSVLLEVVFHIAEGCLFCQGSHGAGAERLPFSEDDLRVGMRRALVLTGEVQVNIRLLVALKAEEGLKGNVKAVFSHLCAAVRADLIRHVTARGARKLLRNLRIEVRVAAIRANVMRRQGIHLGDTCRVSDKGRADRAARSHEIALFVRVLHKLMGDDVHDSEAVLNDGIQLLIEPLLHQCRQRIPVVRMRHAVTELGEFFIRTLNDGRALVRTHRRNALHHARNFLRVLDDNFLALLCAEVGKFPQHLIRGAEIERRLLIRIVILVAEKDHAPVNLILRV